ncbi:endo alpha-1,4 polygalactosaminidase [Brachybacterium huguangmaarense]|uniref:Endo alpha-1,4 polygalactosaminidase n=1 Tax=Brachybacterium huguangmaarense TaxID=1652028 RepID=A0ABY6FY55_9MICO|nr:endo alpha-1,4 polygalactosaminidase [Brachybacterium huguangmaarense]UYG15869.1 endo alpha-1,4 polygalactosaminidase [Brachybacterium huguangmaarense]
MRRVRRWRASLAVAVPLAVVSMTGCGTDAAPTARPEGTQTAGRASFGPVTAFDYQLGGPYTPPAGTELVVRDRTEPPVEGVFSVCYVNGFQTQPGEHDVWPEDALLSADGQPVVDPDWPDEVLLDTSTSGRRDAIVKVVSPWIQGCADAGFQAVEVDNLDSFTRSHGALTLEDNLALAASLADVAHGAGLAVGQKNAAEYTPRLRDEAGFDFAVGEECAAYDECSAYTDVYGEAVIDVEYSDDLPRSFDEMCEDPASPRSMILRDRDLVTPEDDGYVFEDCTP